MLSASSLRADRVVLDRDQLAAGLAQPHADPDRAVAAGAADLERALRAARRDHQPQEPAVLFRHRQLALVLRLDVGEDLVHVRRLRRLLAAAVAHRHANTTAAIDSHPPKSSSLKLCSARRSADPRAVTERPDRERSVSRGETVRRRRCGRARVGHAVGNADRSKAAAGDEQSAVAASAASIAATRSTWPTMCCAPALRQR